MEADSPESDRWNSAWNLTLEKMKLDALAEFAAGVGHEFNNPLATIHGRARMLMRELSDPEHKKHLAIILHQVQRAYEMIADIRLFARPPQPEKTTFDLVSVLKNVVREQENLTPPEKTIYWSLSAPQSLPVCLDPVHIHTVFSILCQNAREAVLRADTPNAKIEMICQKDAGSRVEILVRDNGPGIPKAMISQVFSPYFSGREAGRGLGFGLPKAWRLLEQMQGFIEIIAPDSGQGCRFKVSFDSISPDSNREQTVP